MRFIKKLVIIIVIIFTVYSCEDTDDLDTTANNLKACKWKTDSTRVQVKNSQVPLLNVDSVYFPSNCEKDNIFDFLENDMYVEYSGLIKCLVTESDSVVGKWKLNSYKNVTINGSTYVIDRINGSQLYLVFDTLYSETRNNVKTSVTKKKIFYNSKVQ